MKLNEVWNELLQLQQYKNDLYYVAIIHVVFIIVLIKISKNPYHVYLKKKSCRNKVGLYYIRSPYSFGEIVVGQLMLVVDFFNKAIVIHKLAHYKYNV